MEGAILLARKAPWVLSEAQAVAIAYIVAAGLAIFFLQRHRVELILKNVLSLLEVPFPATHAVRSART